METCMNDLKKYIYISDRRFTVGRGGDSSLFSIQFKEVLSLVFSLLLLPCLQMCRWSL